MAEAHAQLTGRPAACLGHPRGRARPTSPSGSTRPARTRPRCSPSSGRWSGAHRGHEAFQEIDQVATIGGLAKWAAEPDDARRRRPDPGRGDPPGPGRAARARSCCRCPRTCWICRRRADAARGRRVGQARPGRPRPTIRAVIELLASARRPVILAGGGVLRATDLDGAPPVRRAAAGPGHRRLATRRRHLERPPALSRDGRARGRRRPSASDSPRRTRCSSSAAA